MQYKIPVQIENEDKIIAMFSLRQLIIIMIWWWIAYTVFKSLERNFWGEIALVPWLIILWIAIVIALWNYSEMTFLPYFLNLLRLNINSKERIWSKWIDSYSNIEIWYIAIKENIESNIETVQNHKIFEKVENKLQKL